MTQSEIIPRTDDGVTAAFATQLASVLECMTGEHPSWEVGSPATPRPAGQDVLAWRQEFSGGDLDPA